MHYHLVLTQKCNLNCRYCGSSVEPTIMPVDLAYPLEELKNFLMHDPEPVIAFYGGEPAIASTRMIQIMDEVKAKEFVIQTNGTLLKRIPENYIQKFHAILISIDGDSHRTNFYRGTDVYERAMKGAIYARNSGFNGDLIARMTVSEKSDIFYDVIHLLELEKPGFDHVHWQLDVMWDYEPDRWENISKWFKSKYNPGIEMLIEYWVDRMEKEKSIPGIVPFIGIMHTLLTGEEVGLRCGAGENFFSLTTDGRVTFCPILPSVEFAVVGNIQKDTPQELVGKVKLDEPCLSQCEVRNICGGRCLYTNKTKYWGEEGFNLVCEATKNLIYKLQKVQIRVQNLIDKKIISIDDFDYPKVENGVEIIP